MKPYFENDQHWQQFFEILQSWIGTRYRHFTGVKGRGADCTLFIAQSLIELGVLEKITYDYYPKDWHLNHKRELIKEYISKNVKHLVGGLKIVQTDDTWMRGDLVLFCMNKLGVSNHASIVIDEKSIMGAVACRGVAIMEINNYWRRHVTYLYRLMEES
ncbi:MAG TPA: amidase domain-containing protein [Bacteroidales bacterium]|mgnify:CR=1 FL=1|jgi:cell wall-associated NlpC family hydrolase|nr:amidase domain-containing protein [Bacteroidales bacterium]